MLRLFMIVSGSFEALFDLSALVSTGSQWAARSALVWDDSVTFLVRVLGAVTLGLGLPTGLALAPMWL